MTRTRTGESRLFRGWRILALGCIAVLLGLEYILPNSKVTFNARPLVALFSMTGLFIEGIRRWRAEPDGPPEMD